MARWEHDGVVPREGPDTRPRRPDGRIDWARVKHTHVMVMQQPTAVRGLVCNYDCGYAEPDQPVCAAHVWRDIGSGRCGSRGRVHRAFAVRPVGLIPREIPASEGPAGTGWWLCRTHDPEARDARKAPRKAEADARDAARTEYWEARGALLTATRDWYEDEGRVEGFCPPDEACEHHECRLARAWERFWTVGGWNA